MTETGVAELDVVVPFPSWPFVFAPQHLTEPPGDDGARMRDADRDRRDAVHAVARASASRTSGPRPFEPQQATRPSVRSAHAWLPPTATVFGVPGRPRTATGVRLLSRVPSPSWPWAPSPQQ